MPGVVPIDYHGYFLVRRVAESEIGGGGRQRMAARITRVAERIKVEAQRMLLAHPVDTLSGLAPLLRVRPELQQLCRFGAQWVSDHAAELDRWGAPKSGPTV
jgi:hypothetical protein